MGVGSITNFIINIIAKSNLAEVLAKDDAALQTNTAFLAENSNALRANSLASGVSATSSKKKTKQLKEEALGLAYISQRTQKAITNFINLKAAQEKVGYNLFGFSFRVGAWFVPTMALMATSMLPVIAGLLTIASAAILAGGAIAGVFALGALMQMRQLGRGGNTGYGGARRPYESSASSGYARMSTVFEPIWKALESPQLKSKMDNVKWFFTATIGAFAEGLSRFISNIDSGALIMLENMFLNWLPRGLESLALWGSRIVKLVGTGSLTRINSLLTYFAKGIENTAKWLASGGGWGQLDNLASIGADLISTLMTLGKSALPIFSMALSQIYPFPLKPILEAATGFFNALNSNKDLKETFTTILQVIVTLIAFRYALMLLIGVMNSEIVVILAVVAGIWLILFTFKYFIYKIGETTESVLNYILGKVMEWAMRIHDALKGNDANADAIKKLENRSLLEALQGEYSWGYFKEGTARTEAEGEMYGRLFKEAYHQIDISFHSDNSTVDKLIVDGIGEKLGTSTTPSSNLKTTQRVIL